MMKHNSSIFAGWQSAILALVVISAGLSGPAYCQIDGVALLLRQTPVNGGTITPSVGIHRFEINAEITLTAVPKPGYQFVYWLGDVSDPTANNTTAYIDAPKIIIAVFERVAYEFLAMDEVPQGSKPGGGMIPSLIEYGSGGGGGDRPPPEEPPDWPKPPESDDFPVPEPIPEPITIILLGAGAAFLLKRRPKS